MNTKRGSYEEQRKQIAVKIVALEAQRRQLTVVLARRNAATSEVSESAVAHR